MKRLVGLVGVLAALAGCGGGGGAGDGAVDARDANRGDAGDVAAPDVADTGLKPEVNPDIVEADAAPDDGAIDAPTDESPEVGDAADGKDGGVADGSGAEVPAGCTLASDAGAAEAGDAPPPKCNGTTGDFDGDGIADCAKLVPGSDTSLQSVELRKGLPTNAFSPTTVTTPDALPAGDQRIISSYDLDHDGRADLITSGTENLGAPFPQTSKVYLLSGKADGTFSGKSTLVMGTSVTTLSAIGDFDGDGRADVLLLSYASGYPYGPQLVVLKSSSDGILGTVFTNSIVPNFSRGIVSTKAVADVNLDGKVDVITYISNSPVESGQLAVLLNDGLGHFTGSAIDHTQLASRGAAMTVGDLDHDGKPDLGVTFDPPTADEAVGATVPFHGDGAGHFAPPPPVDATTSCGGLLGDFDGDGMRDCVVLTQSQGSVSIALRQGVIGGRFRLETVVTKNVPAVGTAIGSSKVLDLNGDGRADLLLQRQGQDQRYVAMLLRGNADGTFGTPTNPPSASSISVALPRFTHLADFDGDGRIDLFGANTVGYQNPPPSALCLTTISVKGSSPDATVQQDCGLGLPYVNFAYVMALADFNNDGKLDAAIRATANDLQPDVPYQGRLLIALGQGEGKFKLAASGTAGIPDSQFITAAKAVDCNGDGKIDLVVAFNDTGPNPKWTAILLGDGAGGFSR